MRVQPINIQSRPKINKQKAQIAGYSAANVAGVLGASTALSWTTSPETMNKVVNNCGGFSKYLKKYLLALSAISAIGAGVAFSTCSLADKINERKATKVGK